MRVCILCRYSKGKIFSGPFIYNTCFIHYLQKNADIDLHILTVAHQDGVDRQDNCTVHYFKRGFLGELNPLLLLRMKAKVKELHPDIVHSIQTDVLYSTVAYMLRNSYPTILTAYGLWAMEKGHYRQEYTKYHKRITEKIQSLNERIVIRSIPHIVVDAESIKTLIQPWTTSNISVIPAGIEYDRIQLYQKGASSEEGPDIFFVNNLQAIKGADILIKSISIVKQAIPDIQVYLGGKGPQREELEHLVKEFHLEENITFLGFINDEEKFHYYTSCNIVVVPSRWDCQPAALFEAAASGKPVIASDASNPGIVIPGVTGEIFRSGDCEELSRKIITLLQDPVLQQQIGENAKKRAPNFDWTNVVKLYRNVYNMARASFQCKH